MFGVPFIIAIILHGHYSLMDLIKFLSWQYCAESREAESTGGRVGSTRRGKAPPQQCSEHSGGGMTTIFAQVIKNNDLYRISSPMQIPSFFEAQTRPYTTYSLLYTTFGTATMAKSIIISAKEQLILHNKHG